ncbi:3-hydroxyisobutyrate dehydrogenase-like beta-hydroxyacid dehydrogenase [Micromonospora sp. Llam0]|uniref:GNAT family N-acetyltransferase n=1 Tax=Micromonospora sp. Llam0 TaxID=2485143 RepID=UPI000FAEAB31|nr:GNAT family N-acetyltransferase [Micromonospora sp. Llam0]ROO59612.1 3-hydroxyisobutyrate dehydrogenase-like beta-hydroxyacid dehydrogenase [Micromonospora sp. Llam0]
MSLESRIQTIRAFNRDVTERLGVLEDRYLARDRPLSLDRLLWEIGTDGIEVRELRSRLGLDSGYTSRQLRALEQEGLVVVSPSEHDSRVRRATLTPSGLAELAVLDQLSDELVGTILAPLTERQRDELAAATETVRRLFTASTVAIAAADPASEPARRAVDAYHRTLDDRFDGGFRPDRAVPAADDALRPPSGLFLLATLKDRPVGCVGVTKADDTSAEIRRLWVSSELRGLGIGRRLLAAAEDAATSLGAGVVRLDTNRSLTEAIALYRAAGYDEAAPFNDQPYAHHWFAKSLTGESLPGGGAGAPPGRVGFLGLGIMGLPMARRLARSGVGLTVWSRTPKPDDELRAAGARTAANVPEVFAQCDTVIVMLRNADAVDQVLRDVPGGIARLVAGRTIVNMGTLSPEYSKALADEVEKAGGHYVEAPVSGSRRPAEDGKLVAMVAGRPDDVRRTVALLDPMCAQVTVCGPVPSGITMKLAVNVFLIALVTGLAEAFHFADRHGLDRQLLRGILDAGQMSSPISRVKTAKLVGDDLTAQAAIADVRMNAELIVDAAAAAGTGVPLSELCRALYADAVSRGDGALDMVGVIRTIAAGQQHRRR